MRPSRPVLRWRAPLLTLLGLTLLLACDGSGILRVGLGCAILHERPRAGLPRFVGGTGRSWKFPPSASACGCAACRCPPAQELALAAAGPLANLLACAAVLLFMRGAGGTATAGIGLPAVICWWAAVTFCPCPAWMAGTLQGALHGIWRT